RVRGAAGRKRHRAGLQIVRGMLRNSLLVYLLTVYAVRKALQMRRPIAQSREHGPACDGHVILDEPTLRAFRPQLREVHLIRVGQPDLDAIDIEFFCGRCHFKTPAHRRGRSSAARRVDRMYSSADPDPAATARTSPHAEIACRGPMSPALRLRARCFPPSGRRRPRTPSLGGWGS